MVPPHSGGMAPLEGCEFVEELITCGGIVVVVLEVQLVLIRVPEGLVSLEVQLVLDVTVGPIAMAEVV